MFGFGGFNCSNCKYATIQIKLLYLYIILKIMGTSEIISFGTNDTFLPLLVSVAVYKLIAIVVSPAGGALLLILIIALIFTCCK